MDLKLRTSNQVSIVVSYSFSLFLLSPTVALILRFLGALTSDLFTIAAIPFQKLSIVVLNDSSWTLLFFTVYLGLNIYLLTQYNSSKLKKYSKPVVVGFFSTAVYLIYNLVFIYF